MFSAHLLDALCRTGNFRRLVDDACANAAKDGRQEDCDLYRLVGDQVNNAYKTQPIRG